MTYDDDDKKLQENISTNAEYEDIETLDDIESKDGEPLDPIEKDQVTPEEEEGDAKRHLREINEGDDDDQDSILDEQDAYLS